MKENELEYYSNPKMQEFFREQMGPLQHGDKLLLNGYCEDCETYKVFSPQIYKDAIRLPLPIDPVNPERGLLGMLDTESFWRLCYYLGRWRVTPEATDRIIYFEGPTPTLAFLKAIAHKIGAEFLEWKR
jgi:hypothetical protein